MSKFRKLLALALVIAMTFSMLPVFAAADDGVGEVAAVDAAPAAESVAVEDVAPVATEEPAAAPVAEAIETVAAETVAPKAELQALAGASYSDDDAALNAGYFLKLVQSSSATSEWIATAYYNSFADFSADLAANASSTYSFVLYLLADRAVYDTSTAYDGLISLNYNNDYHKYFTFDLNGHTLSVQLGRAFISRGSNITSYISIRNGTILYRNIGRKDKYHHGVVLSHANQTTNSNGSNPLPFITELTDVTIVSLAAAEGLNGSAIVSSNRWCNEIRLSNAKLLSQDDSAIELDLVATWCSKPTVAAETLAKSNTDSVITMSGNCVIGSLGGFAPVRYVYPASAIAAAAKAGYTVPLGLKILDAEGSEGDAKFIGDGIVNIENEPADGSVLTTAIPEYYDTSVNYTASDLVPAESMFYTPESPSGESSVALTNPAYLEGQVFPATVHEHGSLTHHPATPATTTKPGNIEYWSCSCGLCYLDENGTIPTTLEDVAVQPLCTHEDLIHVPEDNSSLAKPGNLEYWYCNTCGQYFLDADATQTTTEDEVVFSTILCPKGKAFDDDDAAVAEDYFLRLDLEGSGCAYYNSFVSFGDDIKNIASGTRVFVLHLLADRAVYDTTVAHDGLVTLNYTNDYHKNFTFDLDGHTISAQLARPFMSRGANITNHVFIRNGTILYRNIGRTLRNGVVLTNANDTTNTGATGILPFITELTDVTIISLAAAGDDLHNTPIISTNRWCNTIKLNNATLLSQDASAIEFDLATSWVSDAAKKLIAASDTDSVITMSGDCAIGSLGDFAPIRYVYPAAAISNASDYDIALGLEICDAEGSEGNAKFVGMDIMNIENEPASGSVLTVSFPEYYDACIDYTALDLIPDESMFYMPESPSGESSVALDEKVYLADQIFPATVHEHGALTHHPATAPTVSQTGNIEYWSCSCGRLFLDEDGEQPTTLEKVTIQTTFCTHENLEHHEAGNTSAALPGNIEYWYCSNCQKYFLDAAATQETTAEGVATPILCPHGAAFDDDSAALAAGYFLKLNAAGYGPAYYNSFANFDSGYPTVNDILAAITPVDSSVTLELLCDYTYYDAAANTLPLINLYATGATARFTFDLGGHTFTARCGRPIVSRSTNYLQNANLRNGTIIYQNIAMTSGDAGIVVCSSGNITVSQGISVLVSNINLTDMTLVTLASEGTGILAAPAVLSRVWTTRLTLTNTKLIAQDTQAIRFQPFDKFDSKIKDSQIALLSGTTCSSTITMKGTCAIGSLAPDTAAVFYDYPQAVMAETSGKVALTVTPDDARTSVFLGSAIASVPEDPGNDRFTGTYPTDYTETTEYTFGLPNVSALTESAMNTTPTTADNNYPAIKTSAAAVKLATFTAVGGEEGEPDTLDAAFSAWMASEQGGTIKLYGSLNAAAAGMARSALNLGTDFFYTSTENAMYDPILLITEAQSGKSLTLDLNNNSIELVDPFLGMQSGVENFDLAIVNGSVSTTRMKPLIVLKGANVAFRLEDAVLIQNYPLSSSGGNTNTIQDVRHGGSYSILKNCMVESQNRAPIVIFTIAENNDSTTTLYYMKDCKLFTSSNKQAPVWSVKQADVDTYKHATFIVDGESALYSENENGYFHTHDDYNAFFLAETKVENNELMLDSTKSKLTTADEAKATLTAGELTFYFKDAADALQIAEAFGRNANFPAALTLNADVTSDAAVNNSGAESAFALDLNGKALPEDGLIVPGGAAGTKVTITLTGADADTVKLFKALPAVPYTSGGTYVIEKGSVFTDYSLGLADDVRMNLYTNGATAVGYVQGGKTYAISERSEKNAWVINTIAARQMADPIDAYAVKTVDGTVTVDFTKGISVKSYVAGDPAATLEDGDVKTALEATLKTLLIYGKFAEKYFAEDYTDLTADELTDLGLEAIPETDLTNLTDAAYVVTDMADLKADQTAESGYYGTSAVLGDAISLKFYFSGAAFDGKTATVNGENAALMTDGGYKYVKAALRARDFDAPVTVVIEGVGSVTDSVSGYTSRLADENAANLVKALRAYGADAMRYAAAKDAAAAG